MLRVTRLLKALGDRWPECRRIDGVRRRRSRVPASPGCPAVPPRTVTAVTAVNPAVNTAVINERSQDRIVWIDCEMTGLDLVSDALIEVAVLVTDSELNVLGDGIDVVIKPSDEALAHMPEVVREMHTVSGL